MEFQYRRNGRNAFVYDGEELVDSAAIVDKMRVNPLWLQDAAPIAFTQNKRGGSFKGFENGGDDDDDGTIDI